MDQLVHAYLEWKHGSQDSAAMEEDRHEFHVSVIEEHLVRLSIFLINIIELIKSVQSATHVSQSTRVSKSLPMFHFAPRSHRLLAS
jgi:hypothetical protein